jgi:transposase
MEIGSIGIDLGKTTFHLVALGRRGEVLVRRKFTQKQLLTFVKSNKNDFVDAEAIAEAVERKNMRFVPD